MGAEGGGRKIQVGEPEFAFVKLGTGAAAAAIIEQVEPRVGDVSAGKPGLGRGVQLPEFADLGALPPAPGGPDAAGRAKPLRKAQRRTRARARP